MNSKIKLFGFNNLTKTLSFNIYEICYAESHREQQDYIRYINEQYNSDCLTKILCDVTRMIGATVLNISKQDYEPQGASATLLISDEPAAERGTDKDGNMSVIQKESIAGHLDKSHVTVHTYPEFHPDNAITTFRVDIDVSTCGKITPLRSLNYLISSFDSDIITIDYKVRGFTRDEHGKKLFTDHKINSIQDYISKGALARYEVFDVNMRKVNMFHTQMMIKEIHLDNYLFISDTSRLEPERRAEIVDILRGEMTEIFRGQNGA